MMLAIVILLSFFTAIAGHGAYYLPGVTPQAYQPGEPARVYVAKLTSTSTQMPYDYYSLPYCKPNKAGLKSENLGEVISGDRIENSVYKLEVKMAKQCEVACVKKLKKTEKDAFVRAIEDEYRVHWLVDNLPVGSYETVGTTGEEAFTRGFKVGFMTGEGKSVRHYLNNHIRLIIDYHDDKDFELLNAEDETTTKIVGFRVEAMSIKHSYDGILEDAAETTTDKKTGKKKAMGGNFVANTTPLSTCNALTPPKHDAKNYLSVDKTSDGVVIFTYDVVWVKSDTEWSQRWDVYLTANSSQEKVHWYSITNSIMIVLFLTIMIAMILVRALRKDIAAYNNSDPQTLKDLEDSKEESGWKLVHGDVFRPPTTYPMLYSVCVGTGVQLVCMLAATLSFALLGLLSPANRGSLVTAFILLFVFMGAFAGYHSSRIYKMFRGLEWKANTLMTAFFYPGSVFAIMFVLNAMLWAQGSSGAIPFSAFFTLLFLWFCVSVPLVFLGSFFGYKKESMSFPVRTNLIPRAVPQQAWYLHPLLTSLLAGILPFGACSVELYFIMSALWLHHYVYIYLYICIVLVILVITVAEVSILLAYFMLCNEDYNWWWRAFTHGGSCAYYILVYALWYHITELNIHGIVPVCIYYGYMVMISFTTWLITGTIGYFACLWFNIQIYGSIKVD